MATPPKADGKKVTQVKVRALRTVYFNNQRYREGDVFMYPLTDGKKLSSGVEKVGANTPERVTTAQEAIDDETKPLRPSGAMDPLGANA